MLFNVLQTPREEPIFPGFYLFADYWDDYGFKTTFDLRYFDGDETYSIGQVKIGHLGMGMRGRVELPDMFDQLDREYFSLGQDVSYYAAIRDMAPDLSDSILRALRDVAFDLDLFQDVRSEYVMKISLMRSVERSTIIGQYHRIATGGATLSPFEFVYEVPPSPNGTASLRLDFAVEPESKPPTNIHAIIGSNGVGKTRLLNYLARAVVDSNAYYREVGHVEHLDRPFANLVSVGFSAFDPFRPIRNADRVSYRYVTADQFKQGDEPDTGGSYQPARLFKNAVNGLTGARFRRWKRALATLEADPLFRDAGIHLIAPSNSHSHEPRDPERLFNKLSSGHKIVLLAITYLVGVVVEDTLVLIDEPETHLHPPLLAAFLRSLSDLLVDRNGVAVIATHSPVVLQETPRKCVWKLRRIGDLVTAERPDIETYGENVGVLTREAFGLEVTRSGFHSELEKAVEEGLTYGEVLVRFGHQLGGEARAVARSLVALRDQEVDR